MGKGRTAQAALCPSGLSTSKAQNLFSTLFENGLSHRGWQLGDVLRLCCPNRGKQEAGGGSSQPSLQFVAKEADFPAEMVNLDHSS